jgi:peptidoglycan/xylan/chitin deacetylase (PgdA/CDA1 family)
MQGTVALTFDDGPSETYTEHIMDVLATYKWKATWFVIGKNIYKNNGKALVARMFKENHQVASHTYTHPHLPQISLDELKKEMKLCEDAILSVSGNLKPNYMRPPYGETTPEINAIMRSMGYKTPISWTFSNQDAATKFVGNTTHALNMYKKYLGGNNGTGVDPAKLSIITLQHDRLNSTALSFESVAAYLYNNFAMKGVRFVTVAECLNDSSPYTIEYNPQNTAEINNISSIIIFVFTIVAFLLV